jgi:ketosteroid isomerase-like protein
MSQGLVRTAPRCRGSRTLPCVAGCFVALDVVTGASQLPIEILDYEQDDLLALRRLVESYALAVDRCDVERVSSLFKEDGRLIVHRNSEPDGPLVARTGRVEIEEALRTLKRYVATTHLVGAHEATLDGDSASGETTCLAHHIREEGGDRIDLVLGIRYVDLYERTDDGWMFAERMVGVRWREERILT